MSATITRITRVPRLHGGKIIQWNVDRNGAPFGQIWTYPNTRTETHPYHVKPLCGDHKIFDTYDEAAQFMADR